MAFVTCCLQLHRYVENGSLANIIKPNKFGPFPESLVAVYIAQVCRCLRLFIGVFQGFGYFWDLILNIFYDELGVGRPGLST